jgi:hypothetical protein
VANEMGDISKYMLIIMIISITIFVLEFVLLCCSCACSKHRGGGCGPVCCGIMSGGVSGSLFIANIAVYAVLQGKMKGIDLILIDFFADNNCSEGDL